MLNKADKNLKIIDLMLTREMNLLVPKKGVVKNFLQQELVSDFGILKFIVIFRFQNLWGREHYYFYLCFQTVHKTSLIKV